MTASLKRIGALIVKELHQVVRDPGNVGIAVILPAVLLLLFGYGMSMDIKNVRIAYLAVPASSHSTDLETRLTLSRYFQTTRVFSTREAEEKLRTHEADAFIALQLPSGRRRLLGVFPGRADSTRAGRADAHPLQ